MPRLSGWEDAVGEKTIVLANAALRDFADEAQALSAKTKALQDAIGTCPMGTQHTIAGLDPP